MASDGFATLMDYREPGLMLRVVCGGCGKVSLFVPRELQARFRDKGWPDSLISVRRRLRCSACGRREPHIGPTFRV